jgi:RNA polymerase sigma factor (sigma-70 family)
MVRTSLASVLRHLSLASSHGPAREIDDAGLLERFCARGEESAFTLLVVRHGPMVLGVCRRLLGDTADAEDAFQATFVVFFRRVRSARRVGSLTGWLHGIAWRVANRARRSILRALPETVADCDGPSAEAARREEAALLDEEISRLPERYRLAVVLCGLRGLSYEEAGRELGWPRSTVAHRLDRARQTLRRRLGKRGVSAVALAGAGRRAVRSNLVLDTVRAAMRSASRAAPPTPALRLADGITHGSALMRRAAAAMVAFAVVGLAVGIGVPGDVNEPPAPPAEKLADQPRLGDKAALPAGALARIGSARFQHGQILWNCTYSPDGKLIASAGRGPLRLWDARTGNLLHHIACSSWTGARDGLFSADGKNVMALDGLTARWFDVRTGKEVRHRELPVLAVEDYRDLALAPHGDLVAVRDDKALVVYDLSSGEERQRWTAADYWQSFFTFAPDGRTLVAYEAGPNGGCTLQFLDARTGKRVRSLEARDSSAATRFCFSPDGRTLVAWMYDLFVWDIAGGKLLHRLKFDGLILTGGAYTPDGKAVVVGTEDRDLLVIDPVAGKELRRITAGVGTDLIAFAPDGKTLLLANELRGVLTQLAWPTGQRLGASAEPSSGLAQLRFSSDGQRLRGWGQGLWEVDWRTGREECRFADPAGGSLRVAAFSDDGSRLVRQKGSGELTVWDTVTGKELLTLPGSKPRPVWDRPAFAPDGRTLYAARRGAPLRARDVASGKEIPLPGLTDSSPIPFEAAVSPGGNLLALRLADPPENKTGMSVILRDLRTGRAACRFRPASASDFITCSAISPDESSFAVAGFAQSPDEIGFLTVVDVRTGRQRVSRTDAGQGIWSAVFSPDGRVVATGAKDGSVRLWEVASGRQRHSFADGNYAVQSLIFSPDGRLLASAGLGPAVVWDVAGRESRPTSSEAFTSAEQDRLWQALAGDDAEAAHAAMRQLLSRPAPAVDLLAARLRPASAVAPERFRSLLRALDADDFKVRERAAAELQRLSDVLEPTLRTAVSRVGSAEVKTRLQRILEAVDAPHPERLRQVRAVEVLEGIGTPQAADLLKKLAAGVADARLTREARASLQRVGPK